VVERICHTREARETGLRAAFAAGQLSIDVYNLRDVVRAQLAPAGQDERSTQ
jgi:hypothetical protein